MRLFKQLLRSQVLGRSAWLGWGGLLLLCASTAHAQTQFYPLYTDRLVWGDEVLAWRGYVESTAEKRTRPMPTYVPRPAAPQAMAPMPAPAPQLPSQTENALNFYGGQSARATLAQIPQRPSTAAMQPAPAPATRAPKPFTGGTTGPTVSPYLNLYRDEDISDLPNYYTYVRPQFEQQATNNRQAAALGRLQNQVRQATAPAGDGRYGAPGTGHSTHFGNTGRYYNVRR